MELLKFLCLVVVISCTFVKAKGQSYEAISDKWCPHRNELFESKLGRIRSADECKKKCTDDPKCVSAEWFGDDPSQCDTSSSCTSDKVVDAPRNYGVVIYVKQAATNPAPTIVPATKPHPRVGATYTSMADKWCYNQNDRFESKLGVFKSADECKKKCTDDPKCVSAEWYGDNPTQCDTSSTCTSDKVVDAPRNYGVVIYVKKQAVTKPHPRVGATYTSMADKWCYGQNDRFESKLGVLKSADECKKKCTDDPKCVSAEWFGDDPSQCDTSSTCTSDKVVDAPRNYGVVIYVKNIYVKNKCTCANGIPKSGASCTSDGATMCLSCNEGYSIKAGESACSYDWPNHGGPVVVVHGRRLRGRSNV